MTTKIIENRTEHNCKMIASYPIQVSALSEDEGGGFQALFPPMARSAVGYGPTPQEAIADLQKVVPLFLKMMDKTEQTLPEVVSEKDWDDFSGKFNVRIAKMIHAQLVGLAEDQGVSLNSLVQTILTSGATALAAGKMFGALERPESKSKLPYYWADKSVSVIKIVSLESHLARERITGDWQFTQEG